MTRQKDNKNRDKVMRPLRQLIITLAALCAVSCAKETGADGEHVSVGETIPAFTVTTMDGATVSAATMLGKPSVIVFFDTTCPDCQRQLPEIEAVWRELEGSINAVAIAREQGPDPVRDYWHGNGLTMPVAAPGNRETFNLFDRGSKSGVPQVYVTDKEGRVTLYGNDKSILTTRKITDKLKNN